MAILKLKKVQQMVGFGAERAQKVLTKPVRYSTYDAETIIELAAENSNIPKTMMAAAFYAIEQQVRQLVVNGHSVTLGQLGTFYVSTNAKAADDEAQAGAKAVYRVAVKFRQSGVLKSRITQNLSMTTDLLRTDDEAGAGSGSGSGTGSGSQGGSTPTGGNGNSGGTSGGGNNDDDDRSIDPD